MLAQLRYALPMAQCYPHHALPANPNGAALPIGCPPHQSQRHSATHTTPSPPIPTAQRYPHYALPPIPTAQRRPRNVLPTNHKGTAPPTRHAHHQSPRHSALDTTFPPPIPTAQRIGHETPTTNPHGTAHRTRHAHNQSSQHSEVTLPPNSPDTGQSPGHSASVTSRTNARDSSKIGTNTVLPPHPPVENKNPSLRIREKVSYMYNMIELIKLYNLGIYRYIYIYVTYLRKGIADLT